LEWPAVGFSLGLDLPYRMRGKNIPAKKREVSFGNNGVIQAV
jgi:hypothetical protein